MTGDPVEESSQALRMGFVQALQTAHTAAALLQQRGGASRSRAEHEQRVANDAAREQRSQLEHQLRVADTISKARQGNELHQAKLNEVNARIRRGRELHDLEVDYKNDQIARGVQDLARRDTDSVLERGRRDVVHDKQVAGYDAREKREAELHELDVEYKKLLIEIRRRAAGFSDSLSGNGPAGEAAKATAAFAASQASSDLSDAHRAAADAFVERLGDDTGLDVGALIDMAVPTEPPRQSPVASGPELLDRLNALTDQLTMAIHLHHQFVDPTRGPEPASEDVGIDAEVVEMADADAADASRAEMPTTEPDVAQDPTPALAPMLELE